MVSAADSAVVPMIAAGLFMAKYTPGSRVEAATSAIMATNDSISMAPEPMNRASVSFLIIFGVVPEEMSEWNPDTAPQAIVMNRKGNRLPDQTGPDPSTNWVKAGIFNSGEINM